MYLMPRAGKHVPDAKGGKTCNRCQGRENMQPLSTAGKHATSAKGGKTYTWRQGQKKHASGGPRDELSAGKHEPGAKGRGGEGHATGAQ